MKECSIRRISERGDCDLSLAAKLVLNVGARCCGRLADARRDLAEFVRSDRARKKIDFFRELCAFIELCAFDWTPRHEGNANHFSRISDC